ncbi:quinolinate synthase NadA [Paludicola sp. MB14-C6]|uniref:quinolinate synthase NadA n=1 Tax=Paludihabitans sp. MB14-C6 TaxID=3070656 RepID=UPI0027DC1ED9|nr:quinolinate synthase NadA [Paludicola sp. MB14-C6]WMJ23236.1 quinolinate synthase NadA [Paludicola sp. MB14-C6]
MIRDIQDSILRLKKEKDIAILAHSYQSPDILEIADYKGDSYQLSVIAQTLSCSTVVMCGVRFMAETLKMLSPEKKVILPVATATCPMAEQISPERVLAFKKDNPEYKVVAYINTTAELKAVCDVCVTSSSALKIVSNMKEKNILFIPDKNLGTYIKEQLPEKNIIVWDGCCPIHNAVTVSDCIKAKKLHPNATILMHPELPKEVLAYGDVIGSTSAIINYALAHDDECIIGTEKSIADYLSLVKPEGKFYQLSKKLMCHDMRITTIMDVYKAMLGTGGEEIILEDQLRLAAKNPIEAMIQLGG